MSSILRFCVKPTRAPIQAAALVLLLLSTVHSRDFEKIPIEQAIRESHQAHDLCRLGKIRCLEQSQALLKVLEIRGALPTQYQYDVEYYRIEMRVDVATEWIYGRVDMTSRATQDNVTFCQIDFYSNMVIDSLRVNGATGIYSRLGNLVTVNLPSGVDSGQTFTVTTFYNGHPVEGGFQAFSFETYLGNPVVTSLSEPYLARTWWPCKDYPDDKADSVDLIVTYPSNLFCASNGKMVLNINNGDGTRTTHWSMRYPITTYLVSVAISVYSTWRDWFKPTPVDSMPVDYWVYPSRLAAAQAGYAVTVPMLDTLSGLFGLYPFMNEKYGMSMFNWGGAMEHQTNTSINYNATYQSIIVHEMGHQWWGDMITCRDWHHIWLNEGFASYTEALWFESLGDFTDLRDYMNGMRYTSGGSIYIADTTSIWNIFGGIVYDKGAWVLHMLRGVIGDEDFFQTLSSYYDDPRYKWKDAVTEDFRDIAESVSGVDLHGFFSDWIYGTYYPQYRVSFAYDHPAADSYLVYVHVRQIQSTNPTVFDMPEVDLSVYNGQYHDFRVPMATRDQDYIFHLGGIMAAPSAVSIDRNDWILKTAASETYAVHIIYDTLPDGNQYQPYQQSVTVRGGTGPYTFQITSGALPDGLTLNSTTGEISGSPSDNGLFQFTVQVSGTTGGNDSKVLRLFVAPGSYLAGDVNGSDFVNISDVVQLVTYIFYGGPSPSPLQAGDANGDCIVNIADAIYLIAYIFNGGPAPVPGC